MVDDVKVNYNYRRIVGKLKILHTLNQPDASSVIKPFLASEFHNLPLETQVEMSQIALDLADVPYSATTANRIFDTSINEWSLYIISNKDLELIKRV